MIFFLSGEDSTYVISSVNLFSFIVELSVYITDYNPVLCIILK